MNGQERRAWLDRQGQNALDSLQYYLGPGVNVNALAQIADMFNPVADIGRAGTAARGVVRPGATVGERVNALGNVATDMASVLAPVAGAAYADDAARGLTEALANWSMPADDAVGRFVASEAGNVGPRSAAETRGAEVLDLLKSGRASEVTDDMLDLGDPVLNAQLNEYLFRNYDLPMDEASRMARAREMGFHDADVYHGGPDDIATFGGPYQYGSNYGNWFTDDPLSASEYGGVVIPSRLRGNVADFTEYGGQDMLESARANIAPYMDEEEFASAVTGGRIWETGGGPRFQNDFLDHVAGEGGEIVVLPDDTFGRLNKSYVAMDDPANIRSRFARFDPRLAHLRNLSAGVGGLGIAVSQQSEQERSDDINDILAKYGVN